jgi:hypothetical protein
VGHAALTSGVQPPNQALQPTPGPELELRARPQFMRIAGGGLRDSHPHDVTITREAPNYHA